MSRIWKVRRALDWGRWASPQQRLLSAATTAKGKLTGSVGDRRQRSACHRQIVHEGFSSAADRTWPTLNSARVAPLPQFKEINAAAERSCTTHPAGNAPCSSRGGPLVAHPRPLLCCGQPIGAPLEVGVGALSSSCWPREPRGLRRLRDAACSAAEAATPDDEWSCCRGPWSCGTAAMRRSCPFCAAAITAAFAWRCVLTTTRRSARWRVYGACCRTGKAPEKH